MINLGGTIIQVLLKLNRVYEQVAGRRNRFEQIGIKLKFSERQNFGHQEFDKATFKLNLTNFIKKKYSFDKYFEREAENEQHQLQFDFIVFTNQGNEQEGLFYAALISLYKLLNINNSQAFAQGSLYVPITHQLVFKQCKFIRWLNIDLLVDPSKQEEEADNSVKLFFIWNIDNSNFRS